MSKRSRRNRRNRRPETAFLLVVPNDDPSIPGCPRQPFRFSVLSGDTPAQATELIRGYGSTEESTTAVGKAIGQSIREWEKNGANRNPELLVHLAAAAAGIMESPSTAWQIWAAPGVAEQVLEVIGSSLYSISILNQRGQSTGEGVAALSDEQVGELRQEATAQLRAREMETKLLMRIANPN